MNIILVYIISLQLYVKTQKKMFSTMNKWSSERTKFGAHHNFPGTELSTIRFTTCILMPRSKECLYMHVLYILYMIVSNQKIKYIWEPILTILVISVPQ